MALGATFATLILTNFASAREGLYHVLVTNVGGFSESSSALALLNHPVRIRYCAGDCRYDLRLTDPVGKTLILQASSNLVNWAPVATNGASTGIVEVRDAALSGIPIRFFRAASVP